ncbi:MAG: N-acetyltransferase [Anaerolineales bacterium]|nr:N-acetyltransferase [Chloroflexota bacterium]MBL6981977.1 N-acetyltransferase [Anaerolineales bacterium]
MRLETPCEVTRPQVTFDVEEIEPILQAPPMDLEPWNPATIELKDGRQLYIREAKLEEAPMMMEYVMKVMQAKHDFYDVVGARVYAELAGWYRKRLKDPYVLVGIVDGQLAGFANGRLMSKEINISLHTMALMRGLRIGAIMYYAKAYYGFEILGNEEWWATYESYNGWKRWGVGMAQPSYPWPDVQHELGGARVYYVTKKYWDVSIKKYVEQMVGANLNFDVSDEIIKANESMRLPDEVMV